MPIKPPHTQKNKQTKTKKNVKIDPHKYVNKGQNRPSEIRLSGVPPIMPIKTTTKKQNKNNPSK